MNGFSDPGWLALFLFFPLLLWLRFFWKKRGGRLPFPVGIWGGSGYVPPFSLKKTVLLLSEFPFWLGTALLIAALAGPESTQREEVYLSRGIDIMVVLDESSSMAAEDFPPMNRFDTARAMIRRFIAGRSGDSIGLVSFGSEAVLRSPPTDDYQWLSERLDEMRIGELGDDTAVGMGLAVAALHLADSSAPEKVILLLTDGDDNAGEIRPETAALMASEKGIRIYTVGVGSDGEVPITLTNPETGTLTRGTIVTRFDEEKLRRLAELTGGGYWRAGSPVALETVLRAVDSLESVERRVSVRVSSRPLHRIFVIIGGALVLLHFLIRKGLLKEMP